MDNEKLDSIREALLLKPYRIIDFLPARTPERFAAAYSALEKHCFRDPGTDMPYTRFLSDLMSRSHYDYQGREVVRIDYKGRPHYGTLPHIHVKEFNSSGYLTRKFIYNIKWERLKK